MLEGGRAASFEDLRRLQYTERVLCEAMRLYPPTWRLVRRAVRDFPVGELRHPVRCACRRLPVRDAPRPALLPRA